ncbi:MAG: alpha/beta hydrolase [Verrucomicrobiota bacterium]
MLTKALIPLIIIALAYLGLVTYASAFANRLIFPYVEPSYEKSEAHIFLKSRDEERIAARYYAVKDSPKLILYSHGNGEDIGHGHLLYQMFQQNGVALLAYDYPGYGLSSGKATEKGAYAAIEAAYKYANETLGYQPEDIILYGRSLGSGPSCWLATQHRFGGIILDGAFTSTFRVLTQRKILPWDKFNNLKRIPSIDCPFLIIHGTKDQVVPFSHAKKNLAAVRSPKSKLWIEGARHNNYIAVAGDLYWKTVLNFIKSLNSKPEDE